MVPQANFRRGRWVQGVGSHEVSLKKYGDRWVKGGRWVRPLGFTLPVKFIGLQGGRWVRPLGFERPSRVLGGRGPLVFDHDE